MSMGKILKLMLVGAGLYLAIHLNGGFVAFEKNIAGELASGNQVVMYSLTTCAYCKQKRQWLTSAGIPFAEYFVDTDQAKSEELNELLASRQVPPGGIGMPIFLVNGDLLVNNPQTSEIRRRLKYKS